MKKSKKAKIVIDTNILISFFCYPGGVIRELVKKALVSEYELILSEEILVEFEKVIKMKFPELQDEIWQYQKFIKENFILVNPAKKLDIIKNDPTDNKIIECAVAAGADYIISGDKHIQDLGKYKKIRIMKLIDFFRKEL